MRASAIAFYARLRYDSPLRTQNGEYIMTIVGVPTEVKKDEYRVGMRPVGAEILVRNGHTVLIQAGAGAGSGYDDSRYDALGSDRRFPASVRVDCHSVSSSAP